ncbi:MAG: glycosyltransferase family 1 protein [Patescibacteria group bacterium]
MKIGINASFLRKPGTGIGQVTANFLQKLAECQNSNSKCQNSEFFLYCEEEPGLDFSLPENFHMRVFLPFWKRDDLIRKMLWEKQAAREAAKDGCDAFLSLYQSSTIFQSTVSGQQKTIRHTMVVHDIIPRLFPQYLGNMRQTWHWKAVERGIRAADHIVAISEHTKSDLMRALDIPVEKISVAFLDVAPRFSRVITAEAAADVLKKYDLHSGYIYHGGGLEIRKNAETLLRAYQQLTVNRQQTTNAGQQSRKEVPPLVISGKVFDKNNKLATDVRGLVEELGLQEKVKLLGFVPDEDLPALYHGALFFVYPSLYEGFGLPVLEALRMSVPALVSGTSSLPEVGGDAVLYVDPENAEEMAAQMERLLTDETLRGSLIARSAPQAVQFSWKSFTEKTLATLE